jgi:membrane-associated phospholipid phosphatase
VNEAPPEQSDTAPLFAMPTIQHATRCCAAAVFLSVVFAVVYGGADYVTGLREWRVRFDLAFEQHLPFIPELSLVYSSLYLMFFAVPFVLRRKQEIWTFTLLMTLITIIAGFCFLVMPAQTRFEVPTNLGRFPIAFQVADSMNLTYNDCPSLHVAYSVMCAEVFRRKQPRRGWLFHLWALAIAISAWLTYQHHLADIVAGYALALTAVYLITRYARVDPAQSAA